MEHGHHRQHPVVLVDREGLAGAHAQRVQERRPVTVYDALRHASGPAGVAHRGGLVLIDVRPRIARFLGGEQFLVIEVRGERGPVTVAVHDEVPDRLDLVAGLDQDRAQDAGQAGVDDDHRVLGVADDIAELVGGQPDVQGVHHRAHAGDGEVRLLVLLVVPAERGHPVPGADPEAAQAGRQLLRPVGQGPELDVARAVGLASDDLAVAVQGPPVLEDVLDREREVHHRAAHG